MGIRTEVVNNDEFLERFVDQRSLMGSRVVIGDDNFITRWVRVRGCGIKMQCTEDATVETTLGGPWRFLWQCLRWRRATLLFNLEELLDGTVWKDWPWTVWMAHVPALFNPALVWDPMLVIAFAWSNLYSPQRLALLRVCISSTEFVKLLLPHFREHAWDIIYGPIQGFFG